MSEINNSRKGSAVKRSFFQRRAARILLVIAAILLILRIMLPYIVLNYVNKTLSHMHGYSGHVQDIDIALYRGAYKIKEIYLDKIDSLSQKNTPFFSARIIDLSVHWKALFQGKLAGELEFQDPNLKFTKDKSEPKDIQKDTTDLRQLLDDFMPLSINRFEILNGKIEYNDSSASPLVDIHMDNTHVLAENLTNVKDTSYLPAKVTAYADVYGGTVNLDMQLDPLAKYPTFDMNVKLENTQLPKLNNFFKAYGKLDVNRGNFGLYSEVAGRDGNFAGYVKPLVKDLDIVGPSDRKDNLLQQLWEHIVGAAGVILRNQKHDQVATKIPLQGSFKNTKADIWYAVLEVLKNAFIQALHPSIDNEINIKTVHSGPLAPPAAEQKAEENTKHKGFFGKLFHKKNNTEPANDQQKSNNNQQKK